MRVRLAVSLFLACLSGCERLFPYSGGAPSAELRPGDSPRPGLDGPRPEHVRRPDGPRAPEGPRAVDRGLDRRSDGPRDHRIDIRAGDGTPVCTPVPPPAAYCADELGCLMVCKQSSTCCYQQCMPSTGGTVYKTLFLCLTPGAACGAQCSSITSASCLICLESTCTSQLKACVADRPSLALDCAEWLACMVMCRGSVTPGLCVAACDAGLAPASQLSSANLKTCAMANKCRGCVDSALGICDTDTLLGCLRNSCQTQLEACWADYT